MTLYNTYWPTFSIQDVSTKLIRPVIFWALSYLLHVLLFFLFFSFHDL